MFNFFSKSLNTPSFSYKKRIIKRGYDFDGANDEINYGNSSIYDIASNDHTISFWIKNYNISLTKVFISKGTYGAGLGFYLQTFNDNFEFVHGTTQVMRVSLSGTQNILTNWLFKKIGVDKWYAYKDGVLQTDSLAIISDPASTGSAYNMYLGSFNGSGYIPTAFITDFRWWDSALSDNQIQDIYNEKKVSSNLIGWWKCNEYAGLKSIDSSISNNDGDITTDDIKTFRRNLFA